MRAIAIIAFLLAPMSPVWAHGVESDGTAAKWTFDPWIVIPLLVLGLAYLGGSLVLLWRTALGRKVRGWQSLA